RSDPEQNREGSRIELADGLRDADRGRDDCSSNTERGEPLEPRKPRGIGRLGQKAVNQIPAENGQQRADDEGRVCRPAVQRNAGKRCIKTMEDWRVTAERI